MIPSLIHLADHQLHGRTCCWHWIVWSCFPGMDEQSPSWQLFFFCCQVSHCFPSLDGVPFLPKTQAKCLETGEPVAIKKVLQDRQYKNRELQLMRLMDHPNVISLKHCFFSTTSRDELFLNLVMEYVPETMYRVIKHYNTMNQRMPLIFAKLYTYQVWIPLFCLCNLVLVLI